MQYGTADFSFKQSSLQPEPSRRRSPRRCPHNVTAQIEIDQKGRTRRCQVVDVSMHGLGCLDCEGNLNLPDNANLIIWLTQGDDALLPVTGRVVHQRDYGAFRHLGIELDPEAAEMMGMV